MNQDIQADLAAVMPAVLATGLLVSVCTIEVAPDDPASFDDGGALLPDAPWSVLSGCQDIPCTAPPIQTSDSTSPTEMKAQAEIMAKTVLHVLLGGYFPQIQAQIGEQQRRAVIDGVTYDIVNAESDSQKQMTRLAVQLATI